jgi:hypothetical protein
MGYRDLLSKRRPHQPPAEDDFVPGVTPPMTYERVRGEATLVLLSPDTSEIEKGMAQVILSLLDERRRRG